MIYDCFTFFNELELLELRLNELAGVVDRFVIVEATRTFTNKPKPLYFQENRARFEAFADKIIHVVVHDSPDTTDPWTVEHFQRNAIARGLVNCRPDDFVLVSDLDEIPRATMVEKLSREIPFHEDFWSNAVHRTLNSRWLKNIFYRRGLRRRLRNNHPFVWRFRQDLYRYYLNCRSVAPGSSIGTKMLRFRDFSCAEEIRHSGYKTVRDAGWHFSWMGGVEKIQEKLAAYAHQERNRPELADPRHIQQSVDQGQLFYNQGKLHKLVPLDQTFPRYLLEQTEKFSAWVKPV